MRNEDDLIRNMDHYYKLSLDVQKEFGGPSVYFHLQAIKEQESNFLSDRHIEMIYATLTSWGMHRMGDPEQTKAKMVEFEDFRNSITGQRENLEKMRSARMDSSTSAEYSGHIEELKEIYCNLQVSISDATIVAHSKTLAHILPDLVPPIDRQYTIRFFTQDDKNFFNDKGKYRLITLPKDLDAQFGLFKKCACRMKAIFDRCNRHDFTVEKSSFNSSYPKIIDNLIMAFVKDVPKPV